MMSIHLVVEALNERALARGMQGSGVRIAKPLNRVMSRKGAVLATTTRASSTRPSRSPTRSRTCC